MGCEEMLDAVEKLLHENGEMLAKDLARSNDSVKQTHDMYDKDIEEELTKIEYAVDFIKTNRGSLISDCRDFQSRPKSKYQMIIEQPKRVEFFKPTPKTIPEECAQLKEKIERMAFKGHRGSIFGDARHRYDDLNCDDITGEPYTPL